MEIKIGDIIEIINCTEFDLSFYKLKIGYRYEVVRGEEKGMRGDTYIAIYNPQFEDQGEHTTYVEKGKYFLYKSIEKP